MLSIAMGTIKWGYVEMFTLDVIGTVNQYLNGSQSVDGRHIIIVIYMHIGQVFCILAAKNIIIGQTNDQK